MVDYAEIYARHAAEYDQLIQREDYQNNILKMLEAIQPLNGATVVEFGAGTGRLTCMLAPRVKHIYAFDSSAHMLSVAEAHLRAMDISNWTVQVADNKAIPLADSVADFVVAGWSFGHVTEWHHEQWRHEIEAVLHEMKRLLVPQGMAIILETLGTGQEDPMPPSAALADYYAFLEEVHGFQRTVIRTDYEFESLAEAERLTRFFFSNTLADRVVRENLVRLPECTGVWSCHFA